MEHHPSETLTILGCGSLGSAILHGLLASLPEPDSKFPASKANGTANATTNATTNGPLTNGHHHPMNEECSPHKPTHFIACVRTASSHKRVQNEIAALQRPVPVTVLQDQNLEAVQAADTIVLGCQPQDLESCIGDPALSKVLRGKLVISLLAGVTIPHIEAILNPLGESDGSTSPAQPPMIVRAMPNTAAGVRSSTTVITTAPTVTPSCLALVEYLFTTIGTVTHISAANFDACTALCGSTPSFFALFLEGLVDGAVALGVKRSQAQIMAAETMKGAAMMILDGESPERLKEKIVTPGGSTIQGLLTLERKSLRGVAADALMTCTAAAGGLGEKGKR